MKKKHKIINFIYNAIIKPIHGSKRSINEIAFGIAIGLFIGLTPTVGIQMYLVWILWYFIKLITGFNFDLISSTAIVWISNPFTFVFMYYGFYITGEYCLNLIQVSSKHVSYEYFKAMLNAIFDNHELNLFHKVIESSRFLLVELGPPTVFGSLFYAIPFAIIGYFWTKFYIRKRRTRMHLE